MKKLNAMALVGLLAVAVPVLASPVTTTVAVAGEGGRAVGREVGREVEFRAKVVSLDMTHRLVTLQGPKGEVVVLNVPPQVRNFDQVHVGDKLSVRYSTAVAAKLERVAATGIRERVETTQAQRAPLGDKPGVKLSRTVEILAEIQNIDLAQHQVTLRGASRTLVVAVPPRVDIQALKVGDEVRVWLVEAAVIHVEKIAD